MKFCPAIFVKSVGGRSAMMVDLPAEPAERLAELAGEIEDIVAGRGVRGTVGQVRSLRALSVPQPKPARFPVISNLASASVSG